MYCSNCGEKIAKSSKFCRNCGEKIENEIEDNSPVLDTQVQPEVNQEIIDKPAEQSTTVEQPYNSIAEMQSRKKISTFALTGFILSLIGIVVAALICGILGVIFSSIGIYQTLSKRNLGLGFAIAGISVSIVDIVFGILIFVV